MLGPFDGFCGFSAANDPRQEAVEADGTLK